MEEADMGANDKCMTFCLIQLDCNVICEPENYIISRRKYAKYVDTHHLLDALHYPKLLFVTRNRDFIEIQ
jgi:hypothetical protein